MISGFSVEYSINGQDDELALQRMVVAFERMADDVADFATYVWPKILPVLEQAEREQFDAEGKGPHRGQWAELSPAYAARKAMEWPGKPILERTGALRAGLTDSSSSFARRVMTKDEFDFGTEGVEYGSLHQVGTFDMPDRPPFDFGSDLERTVTDAALEGVREALRASGCSEFLEEAA